MSEDSDSEFDAAGARRPQRARSPLCSSGINTRLYRYCCGMTGNRQTSEDLVQDVFMKMAEAQGAISGRQRVHAVDVRHRAQSLRQCIGAEPPCTPWPNRISDSTPAEPQADDDHAGAQQADLMRRALLQLPAARREVLVLSRYEFQTYEEIAHALAAPSRPLKVRAHRALKQLMSAPSPVRSR